MERAMTYKVPGWGTWVELRPVGLVGVCQQIHREACSVLYGKSTFAFEDPQSLLFFLDNLTPVAAESLTHLAVKYHQIKSDCTGNAKMEDGPWEDLLHRLSTRHTTLTRLSLELTLEQRPNPRLLRGKGNELTQAFKASGILIALDLRNNWVRLRRQGKGSVMALEFSKLEGQVDRYIWD